jgi:hypothetical protein
MSRFVRSLPELRRDKLGEETTMAKRKAKPATMTSLTFFAQLNWIDGKPLLPTIEEYRRRIFTAALDTFDDDGVPVYTMVLAGRGKKNYKSCDLILGSLYKLMMSTTAQGADAFILENDEGQAADDLSLAKKLVSCNPVLLDELEPLQKEIRRRDGKGTLKILPATNVLGQHGKTASFIGFDEVHGYKNYDLFEALAPDPTRRDALTWITSYDTIFNTPGVPLFDLKQVGFAGTDPRMLFSWYSGDRCTDPDFANLPPELRANPSMASWQNGVEYLEQQRRRLPSNKFRRLHLNLPGSPSGAFFDQNTILAAVMPGRRVLRPQRGIRYYAALDMSGGSNDNCVLCICHLSPGEYGDERKVIVDLIEKQAGAVKPFDPMKVVPQFAARLHEYGCTENVICDYYAGSTFGFAFIRERIRLRQISGSATHQYEALEPRFNAGRVELLDDPTTVEELLTLVVKGAKVTHESGSHDDHACALALAVNAAAQTIERRGMRFVVGNRVLTTDEYKAMGTPIHDPENPYAVTACVKGSSAA